MRSAPTRAAAGGWAGRAPRRSVGLAVAATVMGLVTASVATLDLQWRQFFSRDALWAMAGFLAGFWPPTMGSAFLAETARATAETVAMSALGTLLAAVGGLALAVAASRPATWMTAGAVGPRLVRQVLVRQLLGALRSVPELVWAVLLLIAAGLGPMSGTLALALHTVGVLGRLYAESIENADPAPAAALRQRGVGGVAVFCYATLPQIWPQIVSYTLYRWENNIRAAAVIGVVGAGGLGQMLSYRLGLFQLHRVATVLIAMATLVAAVDAASHWARGRLLR